MPKVELFKNYRRVNGEQQLAWSFERDTVPIEGVPVDLWHRTCDRVVAVHEERHKRNETVAYRRAQVSVLPTYPPMIFLYILIASASRDGEGLFLWRAWMVAVLATAVLMGVSWLVTEFYVYPQYLSLEDYWKSLAEDLQEEYSRFGITVQVKRVPAVLPFLVKILPDGLLSCGIVLESRTAVVNVEETEPSAEEDIFPTQLSLKGIHAGIWNATLQECKALHENQVERIKSSLQSHMKFVVWSLCFGAFLFMIAPFVAWGLSMTSNAQMKYFGWSFLGLLIMDSILSCLLRRFCSRTRAVYDKCGEEWEALATRTEPVYSQYNVTVRAQIRGHPLGNSEAVKYLLSVMFGLNNAERAVGLSFRTDDGDVITIEYGKVVPVEAEGANHEVEAAKVPLMGSDLV